MTITVLVPGAPGVVQAYVLPNTYRDSVELMRVAAELEQLPGIQRAALVMGTPANCAILADAGLLIREARDVGVNDLVIAAGGESTDAVAAALDRARVLLASQPTPAASSASVLPAPRTIAEAVADQPSSKLAIVSTPGTYATAEALKALKRGLHVFLFSDNVALADEIELKRLAARKHLLLMGPDCGTAIVDGIPLGFANVVRRGQIGLVAASGTGLQQVSCLVDALGEGVSHAIGVGGRDLDEQVGGMMMLAALEYLASDSDTHVIVLLSKPPAASVARAVLARAQASGKPVVVNFLGGSDTVEHDGSLVRVPTLEEAAVWAVALARGEATAAAPRLAPELVEQVRVAGSRLRPSQWRVRGLYSGGTLCKEAAHVLHDLGAGHELVDLGDDEFTVGRPHPMIDPRLRNERILEAAADPTTAVLLLDVVLGYGAHPDPANALLPALAGATDVVVVASVCGTAGDPQGLSRQCAVLREAGVLVAPSNAQAARLARL
ncbi:MAG TPA: acyl-CoA synthetase FdrA, partial [Chloroflexota bacterium]|nr:acyl-CoA synthetase FdrA [Chloroflexota bacterium]